MEGRKVKLDVIVHPQLGYPVPKPLPVYRPTRWQDLPSDILHRLASSMTTAKHLCTFELICRASRAAADDDNLWRELCCMKFPGPGNVNLRGNLKWRDLYRFNHKLLYDVLVYRRPDRLLDLGHGVIFLNIPILA